jgi:hypothetical protein
LPCLLLGIVLVIGLNRMLIFAGAIELRPEGIRRESEVDQRSAVNLRMIKRLAASEVDGDLPD